VKPYYSDARITIYCADCREVLPALDPADLVLTDPPYGIGEAAGKNRTRDHVARAKDYGVASWDDQPIDQELLELVIAAGKYAAIFGGNYYRVPPSSCWLVWDKENGDCDFADAELAWTNYGTAVRLKRHLWNGMLRKGRERRDHPTQKPLAVMAWAILKCPGEPQTILDPFMGVGTTLRAAKDLGRRAIGIECEERYCEIAVRRLAQEVLF